MKPTTAGMPRRAFSIRAAGMIAAASAAALLLGGCAVPAGGASGSAADDTAVRQVIEARRLAWNAQDVKGYAGLLAADAELTSATGKTAFGRDEIIRLYVEQRQGTYRDASLPSTVVTRIKFVTGDVAVAEARFVLAGVRTSAGATLAPVEGINSYLIVRKPGGWVISSMRGVPATSINQ